ncbi:hypothetical protein D9V41_06185 [Aeromicrobium phragmitis]|uniref:DNA methylase adenine-specific domain-containing protein n=1 Tax=Aeromicrobium phragmitis TaxID=2478914 RepID=A0A3L8PMY7_9ACTN|nr:N-6 DNA methylase [Aeromicrobium phragmitis]RLV56650.1 hypothetical protein D9V41_06185 [Aeromicrobium phragmitis]
MANGLTLVCPVRGRLKVTGRSADGLTPSEERFRVEAIKYLVDRGYPRENFIVEPVIKKFGNNGRNSFRADFIVLDTDASAVSRDVDDRLAHAVLLAEVKRDNASATKAKQYQVRPLLGFAPKDTCVALYWDNVEQRVFWQRTVDGARVTMEGPLASLSPFGHAPGVRALTLGALRSDASLKEIFDRIEDVLHSASIGPSKRFGVMLQLLLAKLHDEHDHVVNASEPLAIQDFKALGVSAEHARGAFSRVLSEAAKYYERHLPQPVPKTLNLPDDSFLEVMSILAPHRITTMKHSVIQEFYMHFAKGLYKWDLAQYFTPPALTEFIIDVINPQWNEDVRDPACGSADFLTAAFRRGQNYPDYASRVWGADVSEEAVQVAVLNMVLNGDGKSNIKREDSLMTIGSNKDKWDVVVCNPPFGIRILERRVEVLKKFELGREQNRVGDDWRATKVPLERQETGILFAELCIKLARPGTGRVALIVPNGYLGNRSPKYVQARNWLLRHARVAAIIALPRFTFKGSGADVSASVVFLEKRETPLAHVADAESYEIAVEVIDKVGWNTGDKKGLPIYRRDPEDGTFILDENSDPVLDSDFGAALASIRGSNAAVDFPWLAKGVGNVASDNEGWTISSDIVIKDQYLTLDPKRYSRKFQSVRSAIEAVPHFRFRDVFEVVPEPRGEDGKPLKVDPSKIYQYVELQNVEAGVYRAEPVRGWELPARARHEAQPGDFFVGGLWSSVRKWMMVGRHNTDIRVTNGMHRLRLKPECEDRRIDVVAALCSEAYRVQMRGLSRGSDGLAEINAEDLLDVVAPIIADLETRRELSPFVDQLMQGRTSVEAAVGALAAADRLPTPSIAQRANHVMVV